MRTFSKLQSYATIVLFLTISTFWSCQKENVITSKDSESTTKFTADILSNDVVYLDYIIAFNEIQARFGFLDKSKSPEERAVIVEDLGNIAHILNQKGSDIPESVYERAAELLGFKSTSEMNTVYQELSLKKKKLLDKYAFMKEPNNPQNRAFLQKAYALSQRYLNWIVVYTKENDAYVLNKRIGVGGFNLPNYSTEWENNQAANPCQKDAIEKLQASYIQFEAILQEQLGGITEVNCINSASAAYKYGNSIKDANRDYELEAGLCH